MAVTVMHVDGVRATAMALSQLYPLTLLACTMQHPLKHLVRQSQTTQEHDVHAHSATGAFSWGSCFPPATKLGLGLVGCIIANAEIKRMTFYLIGHKASKFQLLWKRKMCR